MRKNRNIMLTSVKQYRWTLKYREGVLESNNSWTRNQARIQLKEKQKKVEKINEIEESKRKLERAKVNKRSLYQRILLNRFIMKYEERK